MYLVRHGESEANANGWVAGQLDPLLTDKGREQALLTAEKLKHIPFDTIICSTQKRAIETAEIIAREIRFKGELRKTDLCREWNMGRLAGTKKRFYHRLPHPNVVKVFGGETQKQFQKRAEAFVQEIEKLEEPILVVTHNGFIRVLRFSLERHPKWKTFFNAPSNKNGDIVELDM